MGKLSNKKNIKITGDCPFCGTKNSVEFSDHVHIGGCIMYKDLPTCMKCLNNEIRVRKINNRRYKVHETQWDEFYEKGGE